MDQRPIGVFDSGVGGLSVVRELCRLLPGEDIVYFGDVGRVPYGTRSREVIYRYSSEDLRFLRDKGVKFSVAACGTASSVIDAASIAAYFPTPTPLRCGRYGKFTQDFKEFCTRKNNRGDCGCTRRCGFSTSTPRPRCVKRSAPQMTLSPPRPLPSPRRHGTNSKTNSHTARSTP